MTEGSTAGFPVRDPLGVAMSKSGGLSTSRNPGFGRVFSPPLGLYARP